MKRIAYLLLPLLLLGCQQSAPDLDSALKPVDKAALQTDKDKLSYSIGLHLGQRMKSDGVDVDLLKMVKGLQDGLSGHPEAALLTDKEVADTMTAYQKQRVAEMAAKQKAAGDAALAAGQKFLEKNKAREGVVTTDSGLQYRVIKEGDGPIPAKNDRVVCHYVGKFVDGTVFDSSVQRGQPVTLPVAGVIPGFTEALTMMKTGAKWELVVPPDLAYGKQGSPPVIPPNSVLVFEIELLNIVDKTDNPGPSAPPAPAK